jgi:tRNA(adenine34) deaminase
MSAALEEARAALDAGEVPVGAVVIRGKEIVGRGHNLTRALSDPTAHAEMLAIRDACARLGISRLTDCSLYVTLEPCPMCAGAMVLARLDALYFGAFDPKAGAVSTLYSIVSDARLNHRVALCGGLLDDECALLLREFFAEKRGTAPSV